MKKNAMLKIAAVLLVAVLLTTCAISSTFAKYVSAGNTVTEEARVAKWGINVAAAVTGDLFKTSYTNNDKAVISSDSKALMAPGTKGEETFSITVSGTTPEVSCKLDNTVTVTVTGFDNYLPVVFYVGNEKIAAANGSELQTKLQAKLAGIFADVELSPDKNSENYYADVTELSKEAIVKWEWPFEGATGQDNNKDTQLGNNATANSVKIVIGTTIYQTGPAVAAN
jgi:outer membrane lipoprotein-sorting protein